LILCGAAACAAAHLRAWYHFRTAKACLARYHFAEARDHLSIPLRAWPGSWRVRLWAARAARLDGDRTEAEQHLQLCEQAQPADPEVLLEWALLRAASGELAPVEAFLRNLLRQGSDQSPLIQEALLEGYIRTYRLDPARAGLEDWLQRQPEDTQACFLQGFLWQQVQQPQKALTSYRRALELDPQRDDARWRLVQCLLKLGLAEEASPHLDYLHRRYPKNPDMTVELACGRFKQGQVSEAQELLDAVLAEHPDCQSALRERGRLALAADNSVEAEKWLQRVLKLNPRDAQSLQLLSSALAHQGRQEEAQVLLDQLKQADRDFARMAAICLNDLGQRPNDPALHSELGALLLRLGYSEAGRNWLSLALQEDPNDALARDLLKSASGG
jgi:tetratricopeptide (TPR) repeat protein